ncbi:20106_t:CDS:2 [Gigaspora margarita]|uniref:20106_t:CDS:1 n=1 Tax=Gigaspora margarita TaxID=4874 RepID=A0ABN7UYP0_GIGMA|nr:20106_t:CDS:2 [Gigaspora margarita]
MSKNCQEIQNDLNKLLKAPPVNIKILPRPFRQSSKSQKKIMILWRRLARAKRLKSRIESLVYSFYLGKILETVAKRERVMCNKLLTRYFISVSIRTFYLFEKLGVKQIYRTSTMNLTMISKLGSKEFQNLVKITNSIKEKLVNLPNLPPETITENDDHELGQPNSVQFKGIEDKLVNANLSQETIMKKDDHFLVPLNSVQLKGLSQHKFIIDQESLKKLVPFMHSPIKITIKFMNSKHNIHGYYEIACEALGRDISKKKHVKTPKKPKNITLILKNFNNARKLKNIFNTYVYAFYLGETLLNPVEGKSYRFEDKKCRKGKNEKYIYVKGLSRHYYDFSIRVYDLFQKVEQIQKADLTNLTLTAIAKMNSGEFRELVKDNDNDDIESQDNDDAVEELLGYNGAEDELPQDNDDVTVELLDNNDESLQNSDTMVQITSYQNNDHSHIATSYSQDITQQFDIHNNSQFYLPYDYPSYSFEIELNYDNNDLFIPSNGYATISQPTQVIADNTFQRETLP